MAGSLVENFLSAFMGAKQMDQQRKREEQQAIHQSVQDALDQMRLEQDKQYRKDSLKSQDDYRKAQIDDRKAMKEDRAADNARLDAKDAASKADQAARDKTNNRRITQQAMGNWAKSGDTRAGAMASAGVLPEESAPIFQQILQSKNAGVNQANAQAMPQNALAAALPSIMQAMMGGGGLAMPGLPQQPMQPQMTMADVENEVSPEFQRQSANTGSLIEQRAAKTEQGQRLLDFKLEMGAYDQVLKDAQAVLAKERAADIPKRTRLQSLFNDAKIDDMKYRAFTGRLRAEATGTRAADAINRRGALEDAKAMRQWIGREQSRLEQELKVTELKEQEAARAHKYAGETIATLMPANAALRRPLSPDEAAALHTAREMWAMGESTLPALTGEKKRIQGELGSLKKQYTDLSGIGETPVDGGRLKPPKVLDAAKAAEFMAQAKGDKEKARQLARAAGYSF